jgi:hypothetical protein
MATTSSSSSLLDNVHSNSNSNSNSSSSSNSNSDSNSSNNISGGHLFCAIGSPTTIITDNELQSHINSFLSFVGGVDRKHHSEILIIPPDYTRYHSYAGEITRLVAEYYNFIPCRRRTTPATNDSSNTNSDDNVTAITTNEPSPPPTPPAASAASSTAGEGILQIMPALGTHLPMSQISIIITITLHCT